MLDLELVKKHNESTGHSVFGPSSLKRIILCNGSVLATLNSPIPPDSEYAAKGTLLHNYCEKAMTYGLDNGSLDKVLPYVWSQKEWEFDDKLLVVDALDYVLKVIAEHTGKVTIKLESEGSLESWGLPETSGTADVIVESDSLIDVLDYKFGFGVQVFVHDNPQCIAYLGGAVPYGDGSGSQKILRNHIVQPTLNHYDMEVVAWDELVRIILVDITNAINKAKSDDPAYEPSMEACRFCNAKMNCEHRQKGVRQNAYAVTQAAKNPATVSKEEWKKYLDAADALQQAIKDIRLFAQDEIRSGRGFPGYKMVAGRSTRKYIDEKKAKEWFASKGYANTAYAPLKLLSFPQAEKILKLKKDPEFQALMEKKTGKPVLQPNSHPKEALVYAVDSVFSDVAATDGNVAALDVEKQSAPLRTTNLHRSVWHTGQQQHRGEQHE